MFLPIIFFHQGNSEHLYYALCQAQHTNPNSRIILLGDKANSHYRWLLGIEYYSIGPYALDARNALRNYIHLSSNGETFERICIERWFILYQFLRDQPEIDRCVYLDSDILVYDSLEKPAEELAPFGMTIVYNSAHTNFINSIDFLGEFCSFVKQHYDEPDLRDWLYTHYQEFIGKHGCGGISDMTFFNKFRSQNPDKLGTTVSPLGQQDQLYAFDECLDSNAGGYELKDGIKNIVWLDIIPYCCHLPTNNRIKFYTLHFQGKSKSKMKKYLSNTSLKFRILQLINHWLLGFNKLNRIPSRISAIFK